MPTAREKAYKSRIKAIDEEDSILDARIKELQKEQQKKRSKRTELAVALSKEETKAGLRVSEHAIIRYCERVLGMDIEGITENILHPTIKEYTKKLGGTGEFPHPSGYRLVIKNNVIVTVLE